MAKKKQSVVIVPKIPTDALRNLAKLDRRARGATSPIKRAPVNPAAKRVNKSTEQGRLIKVIYEDEGADACLGLCRRMKVTRAEMLETLASIERVKSKRA